MSLKVYLRPFAQDVREHTGIGRVVYAQFKYLPSYGIEFVNRWQDADVCMGHTQQFDVPPDKLDILQTHGLFWTGDIGSGNYGNYANETNQKIIEACRRARYITVPSDWVAEPFRRDMRINPVVTGHGIDLNEWKAEKNDGYVLYAKAREGTDVCTSIYAWELASRGVNVVSTYSPRDKPIPQNMNVMGVLEPAQMKDRLQHADVYLATAQETFGITTLESMACSVPVLGFNWGGTKDIVRHKEEGYLVEPHDVNGLMEGLTYIKAHRKEMGEKARLRAEQFGWDTVMGQYADLYKKVYKESKKERSGVSVIIPTHDYFSYLKDAIDSALNQTFKPTEVIVVDDGSTDPTSDLMEQYHDHSIVKYVKQPNQGVASARNHGIELAKEPFIVCLDADDKLDARYLETCREILINDRGVGVTYTGLIAFNDKGGETGVQLHAFDWDIQSKWGIPPPTCIPTAAMFRKDMWERAGGYKQRYAPGEDTEFWTRGLATGFTAEVASNDGLFYYRGHDGSASRTLKYTAIDDDKPWLKDKQFPIAAPSKTMPVVRSYSEPVVNIVITVKPNQPYRDALDSLLGQGLREWACYIINQSGTGLSLTPYPFVKLVDAEPKNLPFVVRFEANNQLLPDALKTIAQGIAENKLPLWGDVFAYEVIMAGCCGGNGSAVINAKKMLGLLPPDPKEIERTDGQVMMQSIGTRIGSVTYNNPHTGHGYSIGNNDDDRYFLAKKEDVNWLIGTGVTQRAVIAQPVIVQPIPDNAPVDNFLVDSPSPSSETVRKPRQRRHRKEAIDVATA